MRSDKQAMGIMAAILVAGGKIAPNDAAGVVHDLWNSIHVASHQRTRKPKQVDFDPATVSGLDLLAWEEWLAYRRDIDKPIRPASLSRAAKQLASYGNAQRAVVEQSMANGWQGLFPLKGDAPRPKQVHVNVI